MGARMKPNPGGDSFRLETRLRWRAGKPYLSIQISDAYLLEDSADMFSDQFQRWIADRLDLCLVLERCPFVKVCFVTMLKSMKTVASTAGVAMQVYADEMPSCALQHPELRGVFESGHPEDMNVPLPGVPDSCQWLTCPHCSIRFPLSSTQCWDGQRHVACGGRISLVTALGPSPDAQGP